MLESLEWHGSSGFGEAAYIDFLLFSLSYLCLRRVSMSGVFAFDLKDFIDLAWG